MTPLRSNMPTMPPRMSPLQFLLLVQLEASPKYGYEMLKSIKEAFEGVWEPKTGTLYPALKSLEKRGLVETQVHDGIDFYHITDEGRRFLYQLGQHQEASMKFSARLMTALMKWMSPELKKTVLKSITGLANEDMGLMGGALNLLDESADAESKLQLLRGIRQNMSKRIAMLDSKIQQLEDEAK
ncbi:MAG: PadR family transcriptional regulator [Candidatus Bathyarchaeota archaeon]|nr:PadR family transcriptional regulator [Candidatus Bathyarchaeota archaeon]